MRVTMELKAVSRPSWLSERAVTAKMKSDKPWTCMRRFRSERVQTQSVWERETCGLPLSFTVIACGTHT